MRELDSRAASHRTDREQAAYLAYLESLWETATAGTDPRLHRALALFREELRHAPHHAALAARLRIMQITEASLDAFVALVLGLANEGTLDRRVLCRFLDAHRTALGRAGQRAHVLLRSSIGQEAAAPSRRAS